MERKSKKLCVKKNCEEETVKGSNYCQNHKPTASTKRVMKWAMPMGKTIKRKAKKKVRTKK